MQRKGCANEVARAVRDWTFEKLPFNVIFSYMKYTNEPSAKTAVSWGCRQVDEFPDEENGITKVFAITRAEWENIKASEKKQQ
jgi:RimJ/RimL family protein N-acetyltransferase